MKINRHNYAAFFIDFFDGNLSEADTALLFSFLDENPDLKTEFDSFEMHTLEPETSLTYSDKADLKKPNITLDNYQTFLVAGLENDLDKHGKQQLDAFIEKNPYVQFENALFEKTVLKSDVVPYEEKEKLKRPLVIPFYVNYKYQLAVAAAVALLLLFTQVFFQGNGNQVQVADNTTNEVVNETTNSENINQLAAVELNSAENTTEEAPQHAIQTTQSELNNTQLASFSRVGIKKVTVINSVANNEDVYSKANPIPMDLAVYLNADLNELELAESNNSAFVSREAVHKDKEGDFTRIAGNTLSSLTNNAVAVESRKTQSGLLRSWKLQAGNFSITHTKN